MAVFMSTDMTQRALGQNYFSNPDCPVNLNRVCRQKQLSHEHDLTETEHYHDFVEIVFILNGQGLQVLEGKEYPVSMGDVFVLQGNQRHYFRDAQKLEIVNVMFDAKQKPGLIPLEIRQMDGYKALFILEPAFRTRNNFRNMLRLNPRDMAAIELILSVMFLEQELAEEGSSIILSNRFQELIIHLSRHFSNIPSNKAQSLVQISRVMDYMENNLSESLKLEELAAMANMSKRNFMRNFKLTIGLSPGNYLNEIRMKKACSLLRESRTAIKEIAFQCGFSDSNYFTKCFKKSVNVTPAKYRIRFKG